MPLYVITEQAGRFVAGHTNTGAGTTLELTERAAAHEVRLGTLVSASAPDAVEVVAPSTEVASTQVQPAEAPKEEPPLDDRRATARKKPRAE
jgi:hypothetical protein